MTRFVVDASAVVHIAAHGIDVSDEHELLAPTLLRSQAMSQVYRAVRRGELPTPDGLDRLERIWRIRIRYLGDAVLRRRAWSVAEQLGWEDTYAAEFVALTQLQADALVTMDRTLARSAKSLVETATVDDLRARNAARPSEGSRSPVPRRKDRKA